MVTATPTKTLTFTRSIKASVEEVYRAFTERDGIRGWLSSNAFVRNAVGGHILMYWSVEQYYTSCEFTELDENKTVAFSWRGKGEAQDSRVQVSLEVIDNQTQVTLKHSSFADDAPIDSYEAEWTKRLDNLVSMLENGADLRITERIIIGIIPSAVSEARAEELNIDPRGGTLVSNLVAGFSAEKAGLQRNDIIVGVAGQELSRDLNIFQAIVGKYTVGDVVDVTYYRGAEKHTSQLELLGYPIPDAPADFIALADHVSKGYGEYNKTLDALFDGVSDSQASKKPAEGEWSAYDVLAHLILHERWLQNWIGSFMQGVRIAGYTANTDARIISITATHPGNAIVTEMKRAWDETVALIKHIPEENLKRPSNLWWMNFQMHQQSWHTEGHFDQIRDAIQSAKA